MMKKIMAFMLALLIITAAPSFAFAYTPEYDPHCEAIILVSRDTGLIMYQKNADKRMYPASLVKLMTAAVVYENVSDIDNETATAPQYVFDALYGRGFATAAVLPGETLSIRDLLAAMLIPSGADAAMILADYVAGRDTDSFVAMMNKKAAEIGMENTRFENVYGAYDDNQYTTAYDMYLLSEYISKIPAISEVCGMTRYTLPKTNKQESRVLATTNLLMDRVFGATVEAGFPYYMGSVNNIPIVTGVKTGSLPQSGKCVIAAVSKEGMNYVVVCMGGPGVDREGEKTKENYAFTDARNLLFWSLNSFSYREIIKEGEPVTSIPLLLAKDTETLNLYPEESISSIIPKDAEISSVKIEKYLYNTEAQAPVNAGDEFGEVILSLSGQELGRVKLVARDNIQINTALRVADVFTAVVSSIWFKLGISLLVLLFVLYVAIAVRMHKRRMRERERRKKKVVPVETEVRKRYPSTGFKKDDFK